MRNRLLAMIVAAACCAPSLCLPQAGATLTSNGVSASAPRKAVTHHEITIGGQRVAYTATVADDILPGADGKPGAAAVTIAYTRDGTAEAAQRPVMFLFNGGPGASSSPLHMSALGPVLRVSSGSSDRSAATVADNSDSPLDAFDLVFIDPVSTGFSRALAGVDPKQWYGGRSDAIEVGRMIDDWLRVNNRTASPRFLAGESYGANRAGLILKYCPQLKFDGVILISGGERSLSGLGSQYVDTLPVMAAGAYFHGRIDHGGRTVEQVVEEARHFARTAYAEALAKGKALPAGDRHRVAQRMASLIGLPVELIEKEDLRISANTYMFNLLKDRNLRTGLLDVRTTSPLVANAAGAIDDPALGVVKPSANTSKPPTPEAVGAVASPGVAKYLREQLQFPSDDPYIGVNFKVNVAWKYDRKSGSTGALIAQRMRSDPAMRLFAASGFYDLNGGGDGSGFVHDGVPADRLTFVAFPGGHQVYDDDANRARFAAKLRTFVHAEPAESAHSDTHPGG
jgi:carboxypeptidase C (cathepsin A)